MSFDSLPVDVQNIYLANYNQAGKLVLIMFVLILCYLYVKQFKQKKDSLIKSARLIRGIYYYISIVIITMSPLFVLFMPPTVPFNDVFILFFTFFTINVLVVGFIIAYNVLYYGTFYLMDMAFGTKGSDPIKKEIIKVYGKPEEVLK